MKYTILLLVIFFLLFSILSCNQNREHSTSTGARAYSSDEDSNSDSDSDPDPDEGYRDGTYCARVEYYYSNSGTHSVYTLHVEIEDNELVRIDWPNGGWLDDTHFTPPDISDGSASFTSDRNMEYSITILGEEGDCSVSMYADHEDDVLQEEEDRIEERQQRLEEEAEERQRQIEEDEEDEQMGEEEEEEEPQTVCLNPHPQLNFKHAYTIFYNSSQQC